MGKAYDIAKEISECRTNVDRGNFVRSILEIEALKGTHNLDVQKMKGIRYDRGDNNYILKSGTESPFLICAHYDAAKLNKIHPDTVPGANDNGSGVGVAIEIFRELVKNEQGVDLALFGAEEAEPVVFGGKIPLINKGVDGSLFYLQKLKDNEFPFGVLNLDCCGCGILGISKDAPNIGLGAYLRAVYEKIILEKEEEIFKERANSDHTRFLQWEIPAVMIFGHSAAYYHLANHKIQDNMDWIDSEFLDKVIDIGVKGTKRVLELKPKMIKYKNQYLKKYLEKGIYNEFVV